MIIVSPVSSNAVLRLCAETAQPQRREILGGGGVVRARRDLLCLHTACRNAMHILFLIPCGSNIKKKVLVCVVLNPLRQFAGGNVSTATFRKAVSAASLGFAAPQHRCNRVVLCSILLCSALSLSCPLTKIITKNVSALTPTTASGCKCNALGRFLCFFLIKMFVVPACRALFVASSMPSMVNLPLCLSLFFLVFFQ